MKLAKDALPNSEKHRSAILLAIKAPPLGTFREPLLLAIPCSHTLPPLSRAPGAPPANISLDPGHRGGVLAPLAGGRCGVEGRGESTASTSSAWPTGSQSSNNTGQLCLPTATHRHRTGGKSTAAGHVGRPRAPGHERRSRAPMPVMEGVVVGRG
jgi:hypothetical protein